MLGDLFSEATREPAECVISVDGTEISNLYPYVTEVTVECSRSKASEASLVFETRRDENGRWLVQDEGLFLDWKPIVIEAAFGSRTEEIMRGYIRNPKASYPAEQCRASMTVQVQDESVRLDRYHRRDTWGTPDEPMTDKQILEQIIDDYPGLALNAESGEGQSDLVMHQDCTDIRLLRQRSEINGYELLFQQGEIYFGPHRLDAEAQATILVYAGPATNCVRFDVGSDAHKPDKIAFDLPPGEGAEYEGPTIVEPDLAVLGSTPADSASKELGDFVWRLGNQGVCSEVELGSLAQAKVNENAFKVKAQGELDGTLYGRVLYVGLPVEVDGVGEWLGGTYYADTVRHRFTTDGYRQEFTLLRNAYGEA